MKTGMSCFIVLHSYCVFCTLKVCGYPVSSTSIGAIVPTVFAYFMSLDNVTFW